MNHPIIGISGSHNVADRQMFVRENYMQSVLRAGGIPVLRRKSRTKRRLKR